VAGRAGAPGTRPAQRGGTKTPVATRLTDRGFLRCGFAKNDRAALRADPLRALQEIAKERLALDKRPLAVALAADEWVEICDDDDNA
jgi:hypothetical protein